MRAQQTEGKLYAYREKNPYITYYIMPEAVRRRPCLL
jgi:hypothetical protein